MVQVNCLAVATFTHAYLPAMRQRARGAVIILASVAGYQPLGCAATYGATKAFDLMLAEALWAENRGGGVDVLGVSPGPVETEFQAVAGETPHPGVTPESVVDEALAAGASPLGRALHDSGHVHGSPSLGMVEAVQRATCNSRAGLAGGRVP